MFNIEVCINKGGTNGFVAIDYGNVGADGEGRDSSVLKL